MENVSFIFFEILAMFLKKSTISQPSIFGLKNFSRAELERQGYELVGVQSDLHFYESYIGIGVGRNLRVS